MSALEAFEIPPKGGKQGGGLEDDTPDEGWNPKPWSGGAQFVAQMAGAMIGGIKYMGDPKRADAFAANYYTTVLPVLEAMNFDDVAGSFNPGQMSPEVRLLICGVAILGGAKFVSADGPPPQMYALSAFLGAGDSGDSPEGGGRSPRPKESVETRTVGEMMGGADGDGHIDSRGGETA